MEHDTATIYIVDDDEPVRQGIALLLSTYGYQTQQFADAGSFLKIAKEVCTGPGCILLDQRMPGMSGLELQRQLTDLDLRLPIIFLSGHATVPTAVKAIQEGAVDFMEKPFDSKALLQKVSESVERCRENWEAEIIMQQRMESLTNRERQVLNGIIAGKPNKVIAQELRISERTVEAHRARVMQKFEVHNVAQLLNALRAPENS